jgi:hypothetical protein
VNDFSRPPIISLITLLLSCGFIRKGAVSIISVWTQPTHNYLGYKMASSRPVHERTVSTNLGGARGYRPLEGKLAIVTGASRGILPLFILPLPNPSN